jgi:cytochrome c oxidase subunit 3
MSHPSDSHAEHYDPVAGKIGMWLFLFTEVMLFGALFIAFGMYLHMYRYEFMETSSHLDRIFGAVNTLILLTSSLTMALSIAALSRGRKKQSLWLLAMTLLAAAGFMGIKAFEWGHKFELDLWPGSETMQGLAPGVQVFYGLYFTMTGLHALHVIIGAIAILFGVVFISQDKIHKKRLVLLENIGLYWHLVDLVWIFLFPLFYLIG